MQIGTFKIPEIRLDIILSETLNKIYKSVKTDEIQSKDMSELLGYKYGTERGLFQKINSMLAYGVLEGRAIYHITKLGEDLLFPEPDREQDLKTQAILNVGLWKELFKKNGKELPQEGLWIQLKNITEVDPATAKKLQNKITNWYLEDMKLVSDDIAIKENDEQESPQLELRRSSAGTLMEHPIPMTTTSLGQLTVPTMGSVEINADTLEIARSYLKILEDKIQKEGKNDISYMICAHCSQDEEHNPQCEDIKLVETLENFEDDDEYKSWQCPKCQYKLWTKMNTDDMSTSN